MCTALSRELRHYFGVYRCLCLMRKSTSEGQIPRQSDERGAHARRTTVATASEWSALGDVLPAKASAAPPREPKATPLGAPIEKKQAEVVSMLFRSRSYDAVSPTDVTSEHGIREIFDRMDTDGSGALSREELKRGRYPHSSLQQHTPQAPRHD